MSIPTRRLPLVATVTYKSTAADGYGGQVVTWVTRQASWACRLYSTQPTLFRLASGEQAMATVKCIGEDKEVHAGDRVSADGATYEVLGPDYPTNRRYGESTGHHVEVYLRAL